MSSSTLIALALAATIRLFYSGFISAVYCWVYYRGSVLVAIARVLLLGFIAMEWIIVEVCFGGYC